MCKKSARSVEAIRLWNLQQLGGEGGGVISQKLIGKTRPFYSFYHSVWTGRHFQRGFHSLILCIMNFRLALSEENVIKAINAIDIRHVCLMKSYLNQAISVSSIYIDIGN